MDTDIEDPEYIGDLALEDFDDPAAFGEALIEFFDARAAEEDEGEAGDNIDGFSIVYHGLFGPRRSGFRHRDNFAVYLLFQDRELDTEIGIAYAHEGGWFIDPTPAEADDMVAWDHPVRGQQYSGGFGPYDHAALIPLARAGADASLGDLLNQILDALHAWRLENENEAEEDEEEDEAP